MEYEVPDAQKELKYDIGYDLCPNYKPEDNPYPLCDRPDCPEVKNCSMSLHMDMPPFEQ